MNKFTFLLILLCLASCFLPRKISKKLPKCVGQYAHCFCYRSHYETGSSSTLLELYDDSTFQLAGDLEYRHSNMSNYFFKFKGKYQISGDSLFLDIKSRKNSYYELRWGSFGLPNVYFVKYLHEFADVHNRKVVFFKSKKIEAEPIIYGQGGYFFATKSGALISEPATGRDTLYLQEINYLPKSFFQKHKDAEDTTFYRLFRGYCLDSVGPRIDIMRFGRSYYPKK